MRYELILNGTRYSKMAIDFADVKIHSRSKGHSAVAAAAYRSAEKLKDARLGIEHNYQTKDHVIYSSIMLPDGAAEKFRSREYLWNKVEESEKRINSVVCKDIVVALPNGLSKEDWISLSRRFTEEQFTSKGVIADISIHDNKDNPHCHILVTTRRVIGINFDSHKARDLDSVHSTSKHGRWLADKNGYPNDWKNIQNEYFQNKNIDLTVDQNYLISQLHEGKITTDEAHYIKEQNKDRLAQAKYIALNDPDLTISILTERQTVFSIKDIESIAYKHSDDSMSKEEYNKIKYSILDHKDIVSLGIGLDGKEHYTTAYAIKKEQQLIFNLSVLKISNQHKVNNKILENINKTSTLSDEQKQAVNHLVKSKDIGVVIGKPGTGKSYMLNTAREAWEQAGYNVLGTTLSGIASHGLKKESGINSRTLHSLNYSIEQGYVKLSHKDILVVDEAGMIDTYQMSKLLRTVRISGAKIVLIGDPDQLQPIGPGAPLRAITENTGFVEMANIRRQQVQWQREATYLISQGNMNGLDKYNDNEKVQYLSTKDESLSAIINDWNTQTRPDNLLNSILIAHRNIDVQNLNSAARTAMQRRGLINNSQSITFSSDKGLIELSPGEKILFGKNNNELGVKNGTMGILSSINKDTGVLNIKIMDGEHEKTVEIIAEKYNSINYGYAATVHKLQGATVDKSYLYLGGKSWNKNLALVAMSRHKNDLKIFADKETFSSYDKIKDVLSRENFKDSVLNYPLSFSLRRGFDPDSTVGRAVDKLAGIGEKIVDKWLWLVNRQAYLEKQKIREKNEIIINNRRNAVILSKFTDLRSELRKDMGIMLSKLPDNSKLYNHPDYDNYFRKQITLNKLGSHIYNNYQKFEVVSNANNLTVSDFKKHYDSHNNYQRVKQFVDSKGKMDFETLQNLSSNIKDHYSHINYIAKQQDIDANNLVAQIKEQVVNEKYNLHIADKSPDYISDLNEIRQYNNLNNEYADFCKVVFSDADNKSTKLTELQQNYFYSLNNDIRNISGKIRDNVSEKIRSEGIGLFNINKDRLNKYAKENDVSQYLKSKYSAGQAYSEYVKDRKESHLYDYNTSKDKRDLAALKINSSIDVYVEILKKWNADLDKLNKHAENGKITDEKIAQIKDYIVSIQQNRNDIGVRALNIVNGDNHYQDRVKATASEMDINPEGVLKSVNIGAYTTYTKNFNERELSSFHYVKKFNEYKNKFSNYFIKHNTDYADMTEEQKSAIKTITNHINEYATKISSDKETYAKGLTYYGITNQTLQKYSERHSKALIRTTVFKYFQLTIDSAKEWEELKTTQDPQSKKLSVSIAEKTSHKRDLLGAELYNNQHIYKEFIDKYSIKIDELEKCKNRLVVTDYMKINKAAVQKWKEYYNNKTNYNLLNECKEIEKERQKKAYNIYSNFKKYSGMISKSEFFKEQIKRQAAKYIDSGNKDMKIELNSNKAINDMSLIKPEHEKQSGSLELNNEDKELLKNYINIKFNRDELIIKMAGKMESVEKDIYNNYVIKLGAKCKELTKKLINNKKLINKLEKYSSLKVSEQFDMEKIISAIKNTSLTKGQTSNLLKDIKKEHSKIQKEIDISKDKNL